LDGSKSKIEGEKMGKGRVGRLSMGRFESEKKGGMQKSLLEWVGQEKKERKLEDSDIDEEELSEDEIERLIREKEEEIKEKNKMKVLVGGNGKR
jgi:hypothetical protein